MEKEFVSYEIALTLKELGFNEPCIRGWDKNGKIWYHPDSDIVLDNSTFSQAFRWFREKYNVEHNNRPIKKFETDKSREISFYIDGYFISNLRFTTDKTYEEAELECLKRLIEIVKK